MGRLFLINLEGNVYSCKHCRTHLATADDVISKSFHGRHGEAYLFDKVANITVGEKKEQRMLTGLHTIGEIFCVRCGSIVGWKYEAVHVVSQMYKEGKFVIEMFKVLGPEAEDSNQVVGYDHTQVGAGADASSNAASDDAADA